MRKFNYIDYLIELKGGRGAQVEIARELGVTPQFIASLKGGKPIGSDFALKLSKVYGDTIDFIITGDSSKNNQPKDLLSSPKISTDNKGVPYYDIDFIGGFDLVFNANNINPSYFIDFPPYNDCDYWINVTGKSMGPLIAHGDIVALKKLNSWKEFLLLGEIYAVITDEFRTIKIIGKGSDADHYTLIPYNKGEEFSNQPIPKHLIKNVFRVKGAIKKFF